MKRIYTYFMLGAILLLAASGNAQRAGKTRGTSSATASLQANQHIKQGFDMRVWLNDQLAMGLKAWDNPAEVPDGIGLEYPGRIEHLYGMGPWVGANVNDSIGGYTWVDTWYSSGTRIPAPERSIHRGDHFWQTAVGDTSYNPIGYSGYYYLRHNPVNRRGIDDDGDGKIDEDPLDGIDNDGDWNALTDDIGSDGLPDSLEVSCAGIPYNSVTNPDPAQDNYDPASQDQCHPDPIHGGYTMKSNKDIYTEHNGIPDHGEPHVDEDYGAVSDKDLYCSVTDTVIPITIGGGHVPMGIEVTQASYAWKNARYGAILPFDYSVINIGKNKLRDVYVGFFADMDVGPVDLVGYQEHNYACYIDSIQTAYIHNPVDFGSTPLGLALLATPPVESLKHTFHWFDYTTPTGPDLPYDWMSSAPGLGPPTQTCQSPVQLSDTRFLYAFGPFQLLHQYDTIHFSVALVSGARIFDMIENVKTAQTLYARGYTPTTPTPLIPTFPSEYRLYQNYPNPFNPGTYIPYDLRADGPVTVKVYNVLGQEVRTLVDEVQQAGRQQAYFDGRNLPSGVYYYKFSAWGYSGVRKMLLVK